MPSVPFHYVDLRTFVYATEDERRVEDALRTFLPEEASMERAESEGHHGDPIVVLSSRLENADDVRHVLSRVASVEDVESVRAELDERVDENCALYLTFDKQAAFQGHIERGDGITLRAKVEAYPADPDTAVENARTALDAL